MITSEEVAHSTVHNEDITAVGEAVIAYPCVAYSITLTNDSAAAGIVNISDSTTYNSTYRILKVAVGAATTVNLPFPKGFKFSRGLSAACNVASVDISVSFD